MTPTGVDFSFSFLSKAWLSLCSFVEHGVAVYKLPWFGRCNKSKAVSSVA